MKLNTDSTTTKAEATAMAKHLLSLLKPKFKTFKIRVWQNLGWHYDVRNNFLSVTRSCTDKQWSVMYIPHYTNYGGVIYHKNPVTAIWRALQQREDLLSAEVSNIKALRASLI